MPSYRSTLENAGELATETAHYPSFRTGPMPQDFWVIIHGERGAEWERVIGTNHLPVRSPIPTVGSLPRLGERAIYLLAIDQLELSTVEKIVEHLCVQFRLQPDEAAAEIAAAGIPILAEECSIIIHNPQHWL